MRRPLAFIAIGAAVALGVGIIAVGMAAGDADDGPGAASETSPSGGLPAGHPSVAATEATASVSTDDDVQRNIARLEKESAADPGDVGLLLDLGDAYFLDQRLRQAERAFTDAVRADPDNTTASVRLAMVWHARGDSARANETLKAVIASDPDQQEAYYSLAIVAFSEGRLDEAKAAWKTAARIDPGSTIGRRSESFVNLLEDKESEAPEADD